MESRTIGVLAVIVALSGGLYLCNRRGPSHPAGVDLDKGKEPPPSPSPSPSPGSRVMTGTPPQPAKDIAVSGDAPARHNSEPLPPKVEDRSKTLRRPRQVHELLNLTGEKLVNLYIEEGEPLPQDHPDFVEGVERVQRELKEKYSNLFTLAGEKSADIATRLQKEGRTGATNYEGRKVETHIGDDTVWIREDEFPGLFQTLDEMHSIVDELRSRVRALAPKRK